MTSTAAALLRALAALALLGLLVLVAGAVLDSAKRAVSIH